VHEHRKHAQHSCQPKLRKLRGYQPSLRVFVPCHGVDNTPAQGDVSSGRLRPPILRAKALGLLGRWILRPTNSDRSVLHLGLQPPYPPRRRGQLGASAYALLRRDKSRALFVRGLDPRLAGNADLRGPLPVRCIWLGASLMHPTGWVRCCDAPDGENDAPQTPQIPK